MYVMARCNQHVVVMTITALTIQTSGRRLIHTSQPLSLAIKAVAVATPTSNMRQLFPTATKHNNNNVISNCSSSNSFHFTRQYSTQRIVFGRGSSSAAVGLLAVGTALAGFLAYSNYAFHSSGIDCEAPSGRNRKDQSLGSTANGTSKPGLLDQDGTLVDQSGDNDAVDFINTPRELSNSELAAEIWRTVQPDWPLLLCIVGLTGATAAVNLLTPSAIGDLVTTVQSLALPAALASATAAPSSTLESSSNSVRELAGPALKLLGFSLLQGFLTFVDIALVTKLGERVSIRLRERLAGRVLSQDISFFDARMQGEVVGRLTTDVAEFKHTFKLVITQGLKAIAQITGTAIQLLRISTRLTSTLLLTMPALYLFMLLYGTYLRRLSRATRQADGKASGTIGEAVSNIRTVRAFASEDRELEGYMDKVNGSARLNSWLGFHIGLFQGLTNASIGGLILMIMFYGGSLVAQGEMTGGQLMTYMVSTQNAQRSLAQVGVLFGQVVKAMGSAARVFEYAHLKPDIPVKGGIVPPFIAGHIEFKDVNFAYPTRKDQTILERFNLTIPIGKVIALCGPSGSGKSTVGQLVERFYDADSGSITMDGRDIRSLDGSWLRDHIGYINQEPTLFATSLLENIRYARPTATREEVIWAAKQANAAGFIEAFPDKYDTIVGERGATLSGGQRQRIAIARAILKDPKILILDEATSALDAQSERIVQDALEKLMKGRTVLVIAHRLSTIQSADMIVVMSGQGKEARAEGNVVEKGTHTELMKRKGAYYRLYTQLSSSHTQTFL